MQPGARICRDAGSVRLCAARMAPLPAPLQARISAVHEACSRGATYVLGSELYVKQQALDSQCYTIFPNNGCACWQKVRKTGSLDHMQSNAFTEVYRPTCLVRYQSKGTQHIALSHNHARRHRVLLTLRLRRAGAFHVSQAACLRV